MVKAAIKSWFRRFLIAFGSWFFDTSENIALMLPEGVQPIAKRKIKSARRQAKEALVKGSLTRVFLENLGYRTILNAVTKGVMFFLILWMTRVLSPKDFGLYSFTLSTAGLFAVLAGFGVNGVILKKVPEYLAKNDKESASRWVLGGLLLVAVSALSVFLLLFLSSQFLAVHLFHKPFARAAIKLAGGFLFLAVISGLFDQIFVSLKRNDLSLKIGLVREMVKLVFMALLIYLGYSYIGAVYGYMLGFFAFLLLAILVLIKRYRFLLVGRPENPVSIAKYSIWFLALGVSATILEMTDIFMISIFLPIEFAGYYRIAVSLVSTVMFLIPIGLITMPLLSESKTEKELQVRFNKIFKPTVLFTLSVAIALAIFGKLLLSILYPTTYVEHAWVPLIFLSFLIPAKNAFWLNAQKLIVQGKEKKQLLITTFAAALNVVLNAFLIPWLGLVGAALASVASLAVGVLVAARPRG